MALGVAKASPACVAYGAALVAGVAVSRALTLLQEHSFRFPTGSLVEERMAMQALALCALQRRHAAETVLSNLEARGSKSQLLPRVRSQCGL